jgi:hypothetical protein
MVFRTVSRWDIKNIIHAEGAGFLPRIVLAAGKMAAMEEEAEAVLILPGYFPAFWDSGERSDIIKASWSVCRIVRSSFGGSAHLQDTRRLYHVHPRSNNQR